MDTATPTSASTIGVFITVTRMRLFRCPIEMGDASSITAPLFRSSRLTVSVACRGDSKCASGFTVRPSV